LSCSLVLYLFRFFFSSSSSPHFASHFTSCIFLARISCINKSFLPLEMTVKLDRMMMTTAHLKGTMKLDDDNSHKWDHFIKKMMMKLLFIVMFVHINFWYIKRESRV
jgi:hypothetical protein